MWGCGLLCGAERGCFEPLLSANWLWLNVLHLFNQGCKLLQLNNTESLTLYRLIDQPFGISAASPEGELPTS